MNYCLINDAWNTNTHNINTTNTIEHMTSNNDNNNINNDNNNNNKEDIHISECNKIILHIINCDNCRLKIKNLEDLKYNNRINYSILILQKLNRILDENKDLFILIFIGLFIIVFFKLLNNLI